MFNEKPLVRVRYFNGQMLSADDFRAEQDYFLEKQRRHNRRLHGYGIVWGLEVKVDGSSELVQWVVVGPGMAIDQYGNEILVPVEQKASLPTTADEIKAWVYLCYEETPASLVPIPGNPAEEESETASRIAEDFKLCLVTHEEADCGCLEPAMPPLLLGRLVKTPAGWRPNRVFRPRRLRQYDEKVVLAAAVLGAVAGAAMGIILRKR